MSCHIRIVYATLGFIVLVILVQCDAFVERPCFSTVLEQCYVGETCEIQSHNYPAQGGHPDGKCVCLRNHKRNDEGYCLPLKQHPGLPTPAKVNADSESSSASIAAGILVPLLFVAVAVLFVLGRRYGWMERLRQPRIRHYDTALVGGDLDDDPPIA